MNNATTPTSTFPHNARSTGNDQHAWPAQAQAAPLLAAQPQAPQRLLDSAMEEGGRQELEAGQAYSVISNGLARWNHDPDPDLAEAISLLDKLKWAQTHGHADWLPHDHPVMAGMTGELTVFLRRLGTAVQDGRLSLAGLDTRDIHRICNGLSACLGASQEDCLLDSKQRERIRKPLAALNRALITQAMNRGLPNDIHSNGMLMDILNWQSRGLRQQLFSSDDQQIGQLFQASLKVMHQWLAPDGRGMPATQIDALDTRQLGKCMVQLNTLHKYSLLDLDAATEQGSRNRKLLGEVALGLCSGLPAGFRAWCRVGDDNSSSAQWQLATVAVHGVPVTNNRQHHQGLRRRRADRAIRAAAAGPCRTAVVLDGADPG